MWPNPTRWRAWHRHTISLNIGLLALLPLACVSATSPSASAENYPKLAQARQAIDKQQYSQALATLRHLEPQGNYEQALIQQLLGYAYVGRQDYPQAALAFSSALALSSLPQEVNHTLRHLLFQLDVRLGNSRRALDNFQRWVKKEAHPKADDYILAMHAAHTLQQDQRAIDYLKQAISLSGSTVPEKYLQMLLALYLKHNQLSSATEVLLGLTAKNADNITYWQQLSAVYLKRQRPAQALAVQELMYRRGMLSTQEIYPLIQLRLANQLPYQAAELLAGQLAEGRLPSNVQNLALLASAWEQAAETDNALNALARLEQQRGDGQAMLRRGQLLLQAGRFQEAAQVLHQVSAKNPQLAKQARSLLDYLPSDFISTKQME